MGGRLPASVVDPAVLEPSGPARERPAAERLVTGMAALDNVAPPGPIDDERMRAKRLARAHAAMARHGLDAMIGFEYANGRYLADLRPLWAPNFLVRQAAVVARDVDRVIVFVHQDDTPHRRATMPWIVPGDIREFPTGLVNADAPAAGIRPVVDALADLGVTNGRIGVDIATPAVLRNLDGALPTADFVDLGPAMRDARSVKNDDELELMRFASRVSDAAMAVAIAVIEPGVRECEVLAEAMRVLYRHGAEIPQCNLIVCSGPNTMPMQRFAGERAIEPGDLVVLDLGGCFRGVFSELARTTVCGTPHPSQRAVYRTAVEIHDATIDELRAGVTPAGGPGRRRRTVSGVPVCGDHAADDHRPRHRRGLRRGALYPAAGRPASRRRAPGRGHDPCGRSHAPRPGDPGRRRRTTRGRRRADRERGGAAHPPPT